MNKIRKLLGLLLAGAVTLSLVGAAQAARPGEGGGAGTECGADLSLAGGPSASGRGGSDSGRFLVCRLGRLAFSDGVRLSSGTESASKLDYASLQRQIAKAAALNPLDWTEESWSRLEGALRQAKRALWEADKQELINYCSYQLSYAIDKLEPFTGDALDLALREAAHLMSEGSEGELWRLLIEAVREGAALPADAEQSVRDSAAQRIRELLERLGAWEPAPAEQEPTLPPPEESENVVIREVEKEVVREVYPEKDYCVIPLHGVWPWLFAVSAAANLALICLMFLRKKKKDTEIPLADYRIDEDL